MTYTRQPIFRNGGSAAPSSYWRGSQSAASIPPSAILTEDGDEILTEGGEPILTES